LGGFLENVELMRRRLSGVWEVNLVGYASLTHPTVTSVL